MDGLGHAEVRGVHFDVSVAETCLCTDAISLA